MVCLNLIQNIEISSKTKSFFNINNIILIILATLISGLGLLYNSTAAILGSMMISPLSKPILVNVIYIINNLYSKSIYQILNFIILFSICLFISVTIGYLNREFLIMKTPTAEMLSRITYTHVIIDVALAALSGVALGIALTNNNIMIETGVALILSITPPLVNFGIFYGEIIYYKIQKYLTDSKKVRELIDKKINKLFDDGSKSFLLFLLNIISLYITLIITLYILCK